ncbi:hypothetical protein GWK47_018591 [Chionoecetes opilio]|uniref:Uncharacterized protein n=1 Tax=Chionoecetes opilio TaxID=41210 RepID=A0A8J4XV52_CHIOP|nr:hypothetical protein GWK47_018591 [Chionoecetes opilio]
MSGRLPVPPRTPGRPPTPTRGGETIGVFPARGSRPNFSRTRPSSNSLGQHRSRLSGSARGKKTWGPPLPPRQTSSARKKGAKPAQGGRRDISRSLMPGLPGGAPCSPRSTVFGWEATRHQRGKGGDIQPIPPNPGTTKLRPIPHQLHGFKKAREWCSRDSVARGALHPSVLASPAAGHSDSPPHPADSGQQRPTVTVFPRPWKAFEWPVLRISPPREEGDPGKMSPGRGYLQHRRARVKIPGPK